MQGMGSGGSDPVDAHNTTSGGFLTSHDHSTCKAELALRMIQGRWKVLILRELIDGVRRFSDLQRSLKGVSRKVLTAQLRELEADGVVTRTVFPQVPPRVDYGLTAVGRDLIPVLEQLHAWGERAARDRSA
jgi:DNA-binding HxlR family transcriptional regulator